MGRLFNEDAIGGARIARSFTMGGKTIRAGAELTRAQVLAIPTANRRALIEQRKIVPFSRTAADEARALRKSAKGAAATSGTVTTTVTPPPGAKRFVLHRGRGKYDVIEGVLLAEGMTQADAVALAAAPPPEPEAKPPAQEPPAADSGEGEMGDPKAETGGEGGDTGERETADAAAARDLNAVGAGADKDTGARGPGAND